MYLKTFVSDVVKPMKYKNPNAVKRPFTEI